MKTLLAILIFPAFAFAQYGPNKKLYYRTTIVTDSGKLKGYFVSNNDSTIIFSPQRTFSEDKNIQVPVGSIHKISIKNKQDYNIGVAGVVAAFGFIVTAGLTKNAGDVDDDGKTSFWELIFTAIEGSTSSDRSRRNTALIVGGSGAVVTTLLYVFSNKRFKLSFPIKGRHEYYYNKKASLYQFTRF